MGVRERLLQDMVSRPKIRCLVTCLVTNRKILGNPSYAGTYLIIYRIEKDNDTFISGLSDPRVVEAWEYCKDTDEPLSEEWMELGEELGKLYPYPEYSQLYGIGAWGASLLHFMQE